MVAQHIFIHDALYRRSILLDQFRHGLKIIGILNLVQLFPEEMSKLFTYSGKFLPMCIVCTYEA